MNKRQKKKFKTKEGYKKIRNMWSARLHAELRKLYPGQDGIFIVTVGKKGKAKYYFSDIQFMTNIKSVVDCHLNSEVEVDFTAKDITDLFADEGVVGTFQAKARGFKGGSEE